jgi:hypothetical protein
MVFQNRQQTFGQGTVISGGDKFPASILCRYPIIGPGEIECVIYTDEKIELHHSVEITATTDRGGDLWIPHLLINGTRGFISHKSSYTITGSPEFLFEGDLRPIDGKGRIHIAFTILPTPLAMIWESFGTSYDGSITRHGDLRKGIQWTSESGIFDLAEIYTYTESKVGFNSTTLRTKEYQINYWSAQGTYSSLQEAVTQIGQELEDALRLCSLLGRCRVDWFQAEAQFIPDTQDDRERQLASRRLRTKRQRGLKASKKSVGFHEYQRSPVNVEVLRDGYFARLLTSYRTSILHSTIHEAIPHLIVSRELGFFEPSLGILYSALEGIIDGVSNSRNLSYTLGNSAFEKLSKVIRQAIREKVTDPLVQESIINKVGELRRRSFKDKLIDVINIYDIDPKKLWLTHENLKQELYAIISRRNNFIHQGKTEDKDAYIYDFLLLQNLVEMLILKILGCDEEKLNLQAYEDKPTLL